MHSFLTGLTTHDNTTYGKPRCFVTAALTCLKHSCPQSPTGLAHNSVGTCTVHAHQLKPHCHHKRAMCGAIGKSLRALIMFMLVSLQEAGCQVHSGGHDPFDCNAALNNFFRASHPKVVVTRAAPA